MALGELRRRRAFEPDRVREAPSSSLASPYWLVFGGAIFAAASQAHGWLAFLDGLKHPGLSAPAHLLWVAVALVGFAAAAFAYRSDRVGALRASAAIGRRVDGSLRWRGGN